MDDLTPHLGLPLLEAAQTQKHIPLNEALARLDALVHLAAASRSQSAPPLSPAEAARWIVGPAPTGAWSGHAGQIAIFQNGGWSFAAPVEGMIARIADEGVAFLYDGAAWTPLASGSGAGLAPALASLVPLTPAPDQLPYYASGSAAALTTLSAAGRSLIGAADALSAREALSLGASQNVAFGGLGLGGSTPDATNRLVVAAPAALFTHAGAGVQFKINKAAAVDTASLLFQNNWAGRAEMGLAGSDDWSLKTSANGSSWVEAIKVAASTGALTLAQPLPLASGGTGANAAAAARTNLGAASAADLATLRGDLERGGSGDMAMPLDSGLHVGFGATPLASDAAGVPAGAAAGRPVLRYRSTGTGGVAAYAALQPVFRRPAGVITTQVRKGDVFLFKARVHLATTAGNFGLFLRVMSSAGAALQTPGEVILTQRGAWVDISARIAATADAADQGQFYFRWQSVPLDEEIFVQDAEIRQIVGWEASPPLQRAAQDMTVYATMAPAATAAYDLGTTALEIRRLYARDARLSALGTTAAAANVTADATGVLLKSTSSLRYKREIEPMDAARAHALLALEPIWYRSTAEADDPAHSWYGFAAEAVAAVDRRFVNWAYPPEAFEARAVEVSPAGQDPETGAEIPAVLETRRLLREDAALVPDGVAYERFVTAHHLLLKESLARIAALERQLSDAGA